MKNAFTTKEIAAYRKYEKVRQSGRYNMITDQRARRSSGLSSALYSFVMTNYSELRAAAERSK